MTYPGSNTKLDRRLLQMDLCLCVLPAFLLLRINHPCSYLRPVSPLVRLASAIHYAFLYHQFIPLYWGILNIDICCFSSTQKKKKNCLLTNFPSSVATCFSSHSTLNPLQCDFCPPLKLLFSKSPMTSCC